MSRQDSIYTESIQTKASFSDTEFTESLSQKNIDSTINKWLSLQKILKESKSLERIIEKQHIDNYNQMKKYIHEIFKLKIKSRKTYEDIKCLRIGSEWLNVSHDNENFYVIEPTGAYFGGALTPIENLMKRIREYYDYVPKIVSLIDENDKKEEIESLVEFFCNQFYTNIFIPNPEQEELLICIYKLLEQEINKMDFADLDNFLDDSTFIGKFMTAFSKQQELNNFFVNLLSKVLNEVDKRNNFLLDLSLNKMMKYIEKERESKRYLTSLKMINIYNENELEKEDEKKGISPIERILENIPRTKINFKKHFILEDEILRDSQISTNELLSVYNEEIEFEFETDINKQRIDYNNNYREDLTEKILKQKMKNFSNPDLISFYQYLINQLNENYHNRYAFSNTNFFLILRDECYMNDKSILAKIYLKNFLFIQEQVDDIIQSLIDKMATIPYTIRCICTIIDKLIGKKFPKLPKYLRHSFIGKFLFNKGIFPILNLENTNGLKNSIFTNGQISCLNCIVSVISNANKCKLFDIYNDVEKTMFNYYLLEIIPFLNNFYDKLVDMQLPNQLTELIDDSSKTENFELSKNIFLFNPDEDKSNQNIDNTKQKYDYFKENSDEIIRIKSICFNEKDIIFILKLMHKNIDVFKNLPEFKSIKAALECNGMNEEQFKYILDTQKDKRIEKRIDLENKGKGYYIFTYNEQNLELNYKLKEFYEEDKRKKKEKGEKSLLSRLKYSIKTILRGLNLLNIKEYSYLNFATSNEKFFQSLNCTLKDLDDEDNKVPLSWHSKFIINNKNQLEQNYIKNDFERLYEEIFIEENNYLNKLKSLSPLINAREAMNLNCAEIAIEKMEYYKKNLEKVKKTEKVKIFVVKDKTEICINLINPDLLKLSKTTKNVRDKNDENFMKGQYIQVNPIEKCTHLSEKFIAKKEGRKFIINSHVKNINDFIYKLIKQKGIIHQTILKYIKEDIQNGKATHQIHTYFDQYKEILKPSLLQNFYDLIEDKSDADYILENVEEYILRKIYKYIFPVKPSIEDQSFYEMAKSYDWLQASDFGLKENIPLEAIQDSIYYLTQMEEKANSISEKIKCLEMVYKNINKITEFYFDKDDKTAEAQTPIFHYIIVKAHPKRLISNINYLNCFTDGRDLPDINFFIKKCLESVEFVYGINPSSLKMSSKEFIEKCNDSNQRLSNLK